MGFKSHAEGKGFEAVFKTRAQLEGLRCLKVPEAGRWMGRGLFKPIPGWCDYVLLDSAGRAAWVDTKSIEDTRYRYSLINQDQLKFLTGVGDVCPAGYVIFFRPAHAIVFISWQKLMTIGPEEGLCPQDGVHLGSELDFSPRRIFACK